MLKTIMNALEDERETLALELVRSMLSNVRIADLTEDQWNMFMRLRQDNTIPTME